MKTYYLTLSQAFPSTHPRAGEPTYFRENLRRSKLHTIRANYDFWRKRFEKIAAGEAVLSVREWVGRPYGKHSSMRELALLTREDGIGIQKLEFKELSKGFVAATVDGKPWPREVIANNDGLSLKDWREWFKDYNHSKPMAIIHFTNFRY
jgi:hypothetical protein